MDEDETITESNQSEQLLSLKDQAERILGWFNSSLNAEIWLNLNSVTPNQAARLLHGLNPHDDIDPLKITTDETNPDDFKNLLLVFQDELRDKNKTLEQWRDIAIIKNLKYHSWIDEYLQAKIDADSQAKIGTYNPISIEEDNEQSLSELFDPVKVTSLEKMFPARGNWAKWAEKAKSNGLIKARIGRAMFNPYMAAMWFLTKGEVGWDLSRCFRTLANNLPVRSKSEKHRLTDQFE